MPDLRGYMAETPSLPLVLHLHGFVYCLWLAFDSVQIALVELRNPALHHHLES